MAKGTAAASARRAAVDRNLILIGVSIFLLVGAVVAYVWRSGGETAVVSEAAKTHPVALHCQSCGHDWQTPYSEYESAAREAVTNGTKILCPKCGQAGGWLARATPRYDVEAAEAEAAERAAAAAAAEADRSGS